MRIRLTPSFAISCIALVIALGGGAAWAASGAAPQSPTALRCVTISRFQNGWKTSGSFREGFTRASACKDSLGYVHLHGLVIPGTENNFAFVLPRGFRPGSSFAFAVAADTSPPTLEDVDVFKSGEVLMDGTASIVVSLDGITFRALG